jgi:hypothetical protein
MTTSAMKTETKSMKPTDVPEEVIQEPAKSLKIDTDMAADLIVSMWRELTTTGDGNE